MDRVGEPRIKQCELSDIVNSESSAKDRSKALLDLVGHRVLDFAYEGIENFKFTTLVSMFSRYDPTSDSLKTTYQIILPVYSTYSTMVKRGFEGNFAEYLSGITDDNLLRIKIGSYPLTFLDYARNILDTHIESIISKFEEYQELHVEHYRKKTTFGAIFRVVDLDKEYKGKVDLAPVKHDRSKMAMFYEQLGRHVGSKNSRAPDNQVFRWICDNLKCEDVRTRFENVFNDPFSKKQRLSSDAMECVEIYLDHVEDLIAKDEFTSFRKFSVGSKFDYESAGLDVDREKMTRVHTFLKKRFSGQWSDVLLELCSGDDVLYGRVSKLPLNERQFNIEKRVAQNMQLLNSLAHSYSKIGIDYVLDKFEFLPFLAYISKVDHNGEGIVKKTYGTHYRLYTFLAKQAGRKDTAEFVINSLPEKEQQLVLGIPQDAKSMYRFLINHYAEQYIEWSQGFVEEAGMFSLWRFFSDMNPKVPREEAQCESRKGPLHKMITFFNQSKDEHGYGSFDEWAISQIEDSKLRQRVLDVPRTSSDRWGSQFKTHMSSYEKYIIRNFCERLNLSEKVGSGANTRYKLSPLVFLTRALFDVNESDKTWFSSTNQGGSLGSSYTFYCKLKRQGELGDESYSSFVAGHLKEPDRSEFKTLVELVSTSDPDIQERAYKRFYPQYLEMCSELGVETPFQPARFAEIVFPEYFQKISGEVPKPNRKMKLSIPAGVKKSIVGSLEEMWDDLLDEVHYIQESLFVETGKLMPFDELASSICDGSSGLKYLGYEESFLFVDAYHSSQQLIREKGLEQNRGLDIITYSMGQKRAKQLRSLFDVETYQADDREVCK